MFNKLCNYLFTDVATIRMYTYIIKYPTPKNLNYMWNYGSMAGLFLVVQIISGLFLTMYYIPHVDYAFDSVDHIMRDVTLGWFVRYVHSNGASMFFLVIYLHMLRGIYYGSYRTPRHIVWCVGVLLYILMMGTAFLGYVLPWGQMSYRAATVITNMLTVIPYIGKDLVHWIWGGHAISNATLSRFFSLHYLLPFVIAIISAYHLVQLHRTGSGQEIGVRTEGMDKVSFMPYFVIKDIFGIALISILFLTFIYFFPEVLSHSDNAIPANPLVTPTHIVPEWYFLPLYGMLRSILDKTYGILLMGISIVILFFLPWLDKRKERGMSMTSEDDRQSFWCFVCNFIALGYLGSQTPISPYIELGVICSHIHVLYFVLFIPFSHIWENSVKGRLLSLGNPLKTAAAMLGTSGDIQMGHTFDYALNRTTLTTVNSIGSDSIRDVSFYYSNSGYAPGFILVLLIGMICVLILCACYILTSTNAYYEKTSAYECGFDPFTDAREPFYIKFYLISILFIVFDVEIIFFFPWVLALASLNASSWIIFWTFLLLLTSGFIYEWGKGAIEN
jgi:quinol-cytochrome oxidoreductase complex cytochrome b subunit/NADH:ubiquinone oxidoreductase subunit 3 (subunit A)